MKLNKKNNTLIYEEIDCWNCNGTGKTTIYPPCPLNYKKVNHLPGKKCPHCGAKNKHSHKSTREEIVTCCRCNGKGRVMEDKMSNLPPEIYNTFNMEIVESRAERNFNEEYLGFGLVGGATDYGTMYKFYKENGAAKTINLIQNEYSESSGGRQAINFLQKGTEKLCNKLKVVIKEMGYSVYPDFN